MRGPVGSWFTATGKAVVRIAGRNEELWGRIIGILRAPGAAMRTDIAEHSQCGLAIIHADGPHGSGVWIGTVRSPRNGRSYGARLGVDEAGDLRLRGFLSIPMPGETVRRPTFWGQPGAACRVS
ncbi:MAG: DUF2147 domain-containing protein [Acetobacteraceae bacterium]